MNSALRVKILSAVSHSHHFLISVPLSLLHLSHTLTHLRTRATIPFSYTCIGVLLHLLHCRPSSPSPGFSYIRVLPQDLSRSSIFHFSSVRMPSPRLLSASLLRQLCASTVHSTRHFKTPGSQISCPSCVPMHSSPLHYLAFTRLTLPFSHLRVNSINLASSSFRLL